jgi:hypothetical protein
MKILFEIIGILGVIYAIIVMCWHNYEENTRQNDRIDAVEETLKAIEAEIKIRKEPKNVLTQNS